MDGKKKDKDLKFPIYTLDEIKWDCALVDGEGGVVLYLKDQIITINKYHLKTLVEHAESVDNALNGG